MKTFTVDEFNKAYRIAEKGGFVKIETGGGLRSAFMQVVCVNGTKLFRVEITQSGIIECDFMHQDFHKVAKMAASELSIK